MCEVLLTDGSGELLTHPSGISDVEEGYEDISNCFEQNTNI